MTLTAAEWGKLREVILRSMEAMEEGREFAFTLLVHTRLLTYIFSWVPGDGATLRLQVYHLGAVAAEHRLGPQGLFPAAKAIIEEMETQLELL